MRACPHCYHPGFPAWEIFNSRERRPIFCKHCCEAAFLPESARQIIHFVVEVSFWSSIFIALIARNWAVLAIFPVALALAYLLIARYYPLSKIDPAAFEAINFRLPPKARKARE